MQRKIFFGCMKVKKLCNVYCKIAICLETIERGVNFRPLFGVACDGAAIVNLAPIYRLTKCMFRWDRIVKPPNSVQAVLSKKFVMETLQWWLAEW